MPSHVLYIDDSGQREYSPTREYGNQNSRHFVFGGPILSTSDAGHLIEAIIELKRRHFGTEHVEVKSNWLRIPREQDRRYIQPYGISRDQLSTLTNELYGLVATRLEVVLIAAVVDKVDMVEQYGESAWYPPAVAYEGIIQRADSHCRDLNATFSVTMDDTTGKTPKRNEYKSNLERQHAQIKKTGSRLLNKPIKTLEGRLRFVDSATHHLIQIADLVSYNVMRQFRDHGEDWESPKDSKLPTYDWFAKLLPRFRQGPRGRIQGYGVVKIPLKRRVTWRLK
jgi:hypothetical protein